MPDMLARQRQGLILSRVREDGGVRGAGLAERDRRDRHAAWHLNG